MAGVPTFNIDMDLRIPLNALIDEVVEDCGDTKVPRESRELLLSCCIEFIQLISFEAKEICARQGKQKLDIEHVLNALIRLGFEDYQPESGTILRYCNALTAKRRRKSRRLENLGIPEEELLRQQQELFAKAREEQAAAERQQAMLDTNPSSPVQGTCNTTPPNTADLALQNCPGVAELHTPNDVITLD